DSRNPYNTLPHVVVRDVGVCEPNGRMEYLDERFPHPPLLPVYPVARAQSRLWIHRVEKDWGDLIRTILTGKGKEAEAARKELTESLIAITPICVEMPDFMNEEFSIVDCCMAPILWRVPVLGIALPEKQCELLLQYMERLFDREAFQASLSDREREMRD